MKGFIFAAGFGERLRPITDNIPKPLIKVSGIPSICYSLALLKEAGISDIVCNLHYRHEDIFNFFRERKNFGFNVTFSIEEKILGTGGGLKRCEKYLHDDDFVIINSDIISDIYLSGVIDHFSTLGSQCHLCLYRTSALNKKSTVAVRGGNIVDFNNILKTQLKMEYDYMGIGVCSPLIFKFLREGYSSIIDTGYTGLINQFKLGLYEYGGLWLDIGTPESLENARAEMEKKGEGLIKRVSDCLSLSGIHPPDYVNQTHWESHFE